MDVDELVSQFHSLKEIRQPWEDQVELVMELIDPSRSNMKVSTDPKSYSYSTNTVDNTASSSAYLMANGLLGNVCSQKFRWFKLTPELPQFEEIKGVQLWLENVESVFYHIFSTGNFYSAVWQVFLDAAYSGLGAMFMTENLLEKTVNFQALAPKGSFIATDHTNKINTYFRHFTLSAKDIVKEYGDKVPEDFKEQAKKKPFKKYELINAIIPREDRDYYKIDKINKPYGSYHVLLGRNILLRESGFDSFPLSIFRYSYDSEETYPHSPSLDGYGDIKRHVDIMKATTDLAQLVAQPPQIVPAELYNEFKLIPDFKLKAYDMSRTPQLLQTGQGFPITQAREEFYKEVVKEHYFTNFFMMLAAAESQQMTATEVLERQGEKATVIGGMISRLTKEFLDPIFDRVFMIAAKNSWIPAPPEGLTDISIDYLGALAQAQERYLKLNGAVNSLQNFLPVLQAYPEMRDIIKPYELGKHLLKEGGMPASILLDRDDYQRLMAAKAQQAAQAQQAEIMQKEADTISKTSKRPEEGSPAEAMMEAMNVQQ